MNEHEILDRLERKRVFSVVRTVDNMLGIREECDLCFYDLLTKEEVKKLAAELLSIAEAMGES